MAEAPPTGLKVENLRCIGAYVLDCNIVVSMFKLQLRYYIHFRTNILGKAWTPLFPSYGLNSTTTVLLQDDFGIK